MERQLLITLLFSLFAINGCQTQKIAEPIALETKSKFVQEVEIPRNLPKNVWEYIIANSDSKNKIMLDEKTSFFLNTYIKSKRRSASEIFFTSIICIISCEKPITEPMNITNTEKTWINLIILFTTLRRSLKLLIFQ